MTGKQKYLTSAGNGGRLLPLNRNEVNEAAKPPACISFDFSDKEAVSALDIIVPDGKNGYKVYDASGNHLYSGYTFKIPDNQMDIFKKFDVPKTEDTDQFEVL